MGSPTRIRASVKDGVTEIRILMSHEMETGRRKDESGTSVPAKYITDVKVRHNERTVLECEFGTAVSKDPYLIFRFSGGKAGDKITVDWSDSDGDSRSDEAVVS